MDEIHSVMANLPHPDCNICDIGGATTDLMLLMSPREAVANAPAGDDPVPRCGRHSGKGDDVADRARADRS